MNSKKLTKKELIEKAVLGDVQTFQKIFLFQYLDVAKKYVIDSTKYYKMYQYEQLVLRANCYYSLLEIYVNFRYKYYNKMKLLDIVEAHEISKTL